MGSCTYLSGCPFFGDKLKNMPAMANAMKRMYCEDNFSECARCMVREALGPDTVPEGLFPNQKEKAEALIREQRN